MKTVENFTVFPTWLLFVTVSYRKSNKQEIVKFYYLQLSIKIC